MLAERNPFDFTPKAALLKAPGKFTSPANERGTHDIYTKVYSILAITVGEALPCGSRLNAIPFIFAQITAS
jgi:hypothetical protein